MMSVNEVRNRKEAYFKWKSCFLKNVYIGKLLKIKWIRNPTPTSTLSSECIGGTGKYIISSITDRLLILKSEHGYNISLSFKDIYTHDNIKYIDFR